MKKIDFMTREEMIDVIETLAWRVAVAENSRTSIIDNEMVKRVLEEEGVKLKDEQWWNDVCRALRIFG